MKRRSSYKLTFFDKHGPDGALRLKAVAQVLPVFGLSLVMFAVFFWATRLGAVRLYEHLAGHEGSSKAEMSSPLVGVAASGDGRSKSVAKY